MSLIGEGHNFMTLMNRSSQDKFCGKNIVEIHQILTKLWPCFPVGTLGGKGLINNNYIKYFESLSIARANWCSLSNRNDILQSCYTSLISPVVMQIQLNSNIPWGFTVPTYERFSQESVLIFLTKLFNGNSATERRRVHTEILSTRCLNSLDKV